MPPLSRRSFIRWVIASGAGMACPFPLKAAGASDSWDASDYSKRPGGNPKLESEANAVCHMVRDHKPLPMPPPSKKVDVVVVGGGPSGIGAADKLQGSDFLVLEKEGHAGGNAYSETWNGLDYCTGAAWLSIFTPQVQDLVKHWKLDLKKVEGFDPACFEGKWIRDFWDSRADSPKIDELPYDASVKQGFRDFLKDIEHIDLDKRLDELDAVPFSDFLKGRPPQLKAYWDQFGPSNWGAVSEETSAALGISAARDWPRSDRWTFEGGLGMIPRKVFADFPEGVRKRFVFDSTVYSVRREGKGAVVRFMKDGRAEALEAKAVVFAGPKLIAKRVVEGLPADQQEAMAKMRYMAYCVYNLCFTRKAVDLGYDSWPVGVKHFTDFIQADWVTHGRDGGPKSPQIVTIYAPKAKELRPDLLDDSLTVQDAEGAVAEFLGYFPAAAEHLAEVRIYRRGHAMPMSTPGWYTRLQPVARRDFGPVFFAHCDSHCDVSDTAYAALNGVEAAEKALKLL